METIFISYRRTDSQEFSRALASELRSYFGEGKVFLDETSALPGEVWPDRIRQALASSRVVLVVLGDQWFQAREEASGRRRIDLESDWVRQEVLAALARRARGDPFDLIPVLVDTARMPSASELDGPLASFAGYQAVRAHRSGGPHDFDAVKDRLVQIRFVPRILPPVNTPRIGKLPDALSSDDEAAFLSKYSLWEIVNTREQGVPGGFKRELHRTYEFQTFDSAFQFLCEVKKRAIDQLNHHPRWQNTYNRVEIWLTTFNLGHKPSKKDARLAAACEEVWSDFKRERR